MDCQNWKAWYDRSRRPSPILLVSGECEIPDAGYTVELNRMILNDPSYCNEQTCHLVLQLVVIPPLVPQNAGVKMVKIQYREVTNVIFQDVTIMPEELTIDIENVF